MHPLSPRSCCLRSAFTLLELMTVLVIIGILVVMVAPVINSIKARAQKAKCIANLRSLHVAANLYVRDNQQWPQLPVATTGDTVTARIWIDVMQPYGLSQNNWICPSIQQALESPDLSIPINTRIDYFATPFNTKQNAPFQQPRQPWFIEAADVHGNGQEIIFPDGHIEEAGDIIRGK